MDIGKALKEMRLENEITQKQLAEKTKISQQAISNWENNQRTPNILECIILADFYKISLDELVDREF